ncbi:MAG: ABC transporter ATP-binding protein [Syntrophobacteraceae bacterium]
MNYDQETLEDEQNRFHGDFKIIARLLQFVLPQWKSVAVAVGLALVITGASLTWPKLLQLAMDHYILDDSLPLSVRIGGITHIACIFLAVIVTSFIANFCQVVALEWAGQKTMDGLRQSLFKHVMRLNLSFFSANRVGRLVTRHTNDIQNMYEMFTSVIVTLFNEGVRMVGILAVLLWMDWRLSLLLAATFPIIFVVSLLFGRLSRLAFRRIRSHLAGINAFLQETVLGMPVIQMFSRQKDMRGRFAAMNEKYLGAAIYQIRVFSIFVPLIDIMGSLSVALIIWYGGGLVLKKYMTIGVLAAFISYMRLFFQPIREFAQKYNIVQSAMASAERIFQLFDESGYAPRSTDAEKLDNIKGHIEFREVGFSYEPDRPVLKNVSFQIEPGRTLAIIGATGSGKTTITNLLERFYDAGHGKILLDGVDIRSFDKRLLREHLGLIMQDVFIVPGSIRENIVLDRQLDQARIETITRLAQLDVFLRKLPLGLETLVGEGAMDLSAGQKQLLAFARVLARDPKILILDEATSNIDSETEMLIEQAMKAVTENRTCIVIAHRLSTIRRANRIVIMEHGRIVEQGSHEDLMELEGAYHHLQMLQSGSFAAQIG